MAGLWLFKRNAKHRFAMRRHQHHNHHHDNQPGSSLNGDALHALSNHSARESSVCAALIYSFALCSISKLGDGDESNGLESILAIIVLIAAIGTSMSVYILTNDWCWREVALRIMAVRECGNASARVLWPG